MWLQTSQIHIAQGRTFTLQNPDTRAREGDTVGLGPVEIDFVDCAVAKLDVGEFGCAQVEVRDPTVSHDDLLPHAVMSHACTDPCARDLGVDVLPRGIVKVSARQSSILLPENRAPVRFTGDSASPKFNLVNEESRYVAWVESTSARSRSVNSMPSRNSSGSISPR